MIAFEYIPNDDQKDVRRVCCSSRSHIADSFRTEFFTTISVSIDSYGLAKLAEICQPSRHRTISQVHQVHDLGFPDIVTACARSCFAFTLLANKGPRSDSLSPWRPPRTHFLALAFHR